MHSADILVAGKGMAALVLSFFLDKKGIDHVLLCRNGQAQELALAETLPPSALPLLKRTGLLELFENHSIHKTYGYHSSWGTGSVTDHNFYFQHPSAYGLKIDKQAIIQELHRKQEKYLICYDRNLQLTTGDDDITVSFELNGQTQTLKNKLVADATGRNRAILTRLGIAAKGYDELTAYSCHLPRFKHPALTHPVYTETFTDGWGIVSGLDAQTNVLTLYTDRSLTVRSKFGRYENWPDILSETKYLKEFLTGDDAVRIKGHLANSSKAAIIAGKHWLAVGDAAIAFDPLSSHGITNAVYTAWRAADAIEDALRDGNSQPLKMYADDLSVIFEQYLQTKNQLYQWERRWLRADFWRRRHLTERTVERINKLINLSQCRT